MRQAGVLHNRLERMSGTKLQQQQQQLVEWGKKQTEKPNQTPIQRCDLLLLMLLLCVLRMWAKTERK